MASIVIQEGHVARTRGATGTRREQEFANLLSPLIADGLIRRGHSVTVIGADAPVPYCQVFIALHTDGSGDPNRRGASVGYPDARSAQLAAAWKAAHQLHGYPGGFHRDNYTDGLRYYYGFRKANGTWEFLAEHGTTTNASDGSWLFDNPAKCAQAHIDAIGNVVGHPIPDFGGAVKPQYDPPFEMPPTVSYLRHPVTGGVAFLLADGGIWNFDTPFNGNVQGKAYFQGRIPAQLLLNPKWDQTHSGTNATPWYIIKSTDGAEYGHAGF